MLEMLSLKGSTRTGHSILVADLEPGTIADKYSAFPDVSITRILVSRDDLIEKSRSIYAPNLSDPWL